LLVLIVTDEPGAKLTDPLVVTEPVTGSGVLPMITVGVFTTLVFTVGGPF
jgi:hypothetical protein